MHGLKCLRQWFAYGLYIVFVIAIMNQAKSRLCGRCRRPLICNFKVSTRNTTFQTRPHFTTAMHHELPDIFRSFLAIRFGVLGHGRSTPKLGTTPRATEGALWKPREMLQKINAKSEGKLSRAWQRISSIDTFAIARGAQLPLSEVSSIFCECFADEGSD